jgi:bile acid:Na+ symporter, BASS family
VVLAPVLLGAWANSAQPKLTRRVAQFSPLAATLLVCLIVGSTLAHNTAALAATGARLLVCMVALHGSGFALGYTLSRVLRLSEAICRTNSIEVGMQNSTLGAVLAALHFADPLVAAPCALSACTHAIMGSLLAAYWRSQDDKRSLAEAAAA